SPQVSHQSSPFRRPRFRGDDELGEGIELQPRVGGGVDAVGIADHRRRRLFADGDAGGAFGGRRVDQYGGVGRAGDVAPVGVGGRRGVGRDRRGGAPLGGGRPGGRQSAR